MFANWRGHRLSASVSFKEEEKVEGIGSILGLSPSTRSLKESLRRTFSADMSSKIWLAQHLSLKKSASSEEFSSISAPKNYSSSSSSASSSVSEEEETQEESSMELERKGDFDIWSAIQSQKVIGSNDSALTPYIHPLVKRSASSLSEKSLEICTESLGSESGSDGFSSSDDFDYLPSHLRKEEEDEEQEQRVELEEVNKKELGCVNYNCSVSRKSPTRSFPPPLPSLSSRDGPCLHMRPYRKDGRLVLEAVPVPPHNYLHAHRQRGRLQLTLIKTPPSEGEEEIDDEDDEECPKQGSQTQLQQDEDDDDDFDKYDDNEEEKEEENVVIDEGVMVEVKITREDVANRVMKVHRSALVMNKIMSGKPIKNPNPWMEKSAEEREKCRKVSQLLPVPPFNAYECCWRSSSSPLHLPYPPNHHLLSNKHFLLKAQDFLLVKRCKEARKPLLIWEPRCIATSS